MAGGPIRISILADTKDLKANLGSAEQAMDKAADTAKSAGSKIDGAFDSTAESADTVASKGAQAAGALSGLGGLVGGQFGAAMTAGGVAMQAFADAGDLVNVVTESAIVRKAKDVVATTAKKAADLAAATASKAMAAAQWAVNAAMEANPIGLVVVALAALVGGLVLAYKKSETFRNIVNSAFGAVRKAGQALWGALKVAFNAIRGGLAGVGSSASTLSKLVSGAVGKIRSGFNAVGSAATTVRNTVSNAFDQIWQKISALPGRVAGLGGRMLSAGQSLIGKLLDGLGDFAGGAVDVARSIANDLIDYLNGILPHHIDINAGPIHVGVPLFPDIPHLAGGGITTGPTLALVGDNPGGREAVIPLDRYDLSGRQILDVLGGILSELQAQTRAGAQHHAEELGVLRTVGADAGAGAVRVVQGLAAKGARDRR